MSPEVVVLAIASLIFLAVRSYQAPHVGGRDFVPVYTAARCLIAGCDPYNTSELQRQYFENGGLAKQLQPWETEPPVHPPSTFLTLFPFMVVRFPTALRFWILFTGSLLILAVFVLLWACPPRTKWLVVAMGVLFLNSGGTIMLMIGQPATFAIPLAVIGTVLFLSDRYVPFAALLLMLSLAVKPQIAGLIVLYLLVRNIHGRWAAVALAGSAALLLIGASIITWQMHGVHWITEWRSHLAVSLDPGAANDPRPMHKDSMWLTNLQVVTSIFVGDPRIFNAVAYLIFAALLSLWMVAIMKSRLSGEYHYLAVVALAALSLIPIYHRWYDSGLLLLAIPTIPMVLKKSRVLGIAIATAMFFIFSGYPQEWLKGQHFSNATWFGTIQSKLMFVLTNRQSCLDVLLLAILLLVAMFVVPSSSERPGQLSTAKTVVG